MVQGALFASPLGAVATGFAIGGVAAVQSVGNDLIGGNRDAGDIALRAFTHGVVSGVISGFGKGIANLFAPNLGNVSNHIAPAVTQGAAAAMKIVSSAAKYATTAVRTMFRTIINRRWRTT